MKRCCAAFTCPFRECFSRANARTHLDQRTVIQISNKCPASKEVPDRILESCACEYGPF